MNKQERSRAAGIRAALEGRAESRLCPKVGDHIIQEAGQPCPECGDEMGHGVTAKMHANLSRRAEQRTILSLVERQWRAHPENDLLEVLGWLDVPGGAPLRELRDEELAVQLMEIAPGR